jgi:uncharacterized protein DUF397
MKIESPLSIATKETIWRVSTYSGGNNECVEVGRGPSECVPVRDSKRSEGPVLHFEHDTWDAFISHIG